MGSVIVDYWQERTSKTLGSSSYRYRRVETNATQRAYEGKAPLGETPMT